MKRQLRYVWIKHFLLSRLRQKMALLFTPESAVPAGDEKDETWYNNAGAIIINQMCAIAASGLRIL